MEFNAFLAALKSSLVERGIDQNTADRYVTAVSRSFKEDDLHRIATYQKPSDFASLSDNLSAAIKRKKAAETPNKSSAAAPAQQSPARIAPQSRSAASSRRVRPTQNTQAAPEKKSFPDNVIDFFRTLPARFSAAKKKPAQDDNDSEFMEVGENGKKIFWIAFACLSPLLLFFLLVYFGFFAALYVAVALAIVFCVIVLVLLVAAGSAVALIGLVYGVIRLFSIPAEGLYEIGLAIIIIGLVMLFGVLIYNLALRVLPLLFRQIKRLFLFTFDKLKALYYYLKKECYKL